LHALTQCICFRCTFHENFHTTNYTDETTAGCTIIVSRVFLCPHPALGRAENQVRIGHVASAGDSILLPLRCCSIQTRSPALPRGVLAERFFSWHHAHSYAILPAIEKRQIPALSDSSPSLRGNVSVECGFIQHVGEGGEEWRGGPLRSPAGVGQCFRAT